MPLHLVVNLTRSARDSHDLTVQLGAPTVRPRGSRLPGAGGTLPGTGDDGSTAVEASPSLVYGAGLLIPLGVQPPRGFESLSLRHALVAQSG